MPPEDPIHRGEFNAAMHGMREQMAGLEKQVVERTARIEGKQDAASAAQLEAARESGRNDARLAAIEAAQRDDRGRIERLDLKVWGLIILALGALGKFFLGLMAAGVP